MGHKILSVFVCRKNSYRGGEIGKSVYENFKKTEIGGKNVNKDFTEIVRAALSGDEAAFEALYTMTKDSAYFIALSLTHNEQDALDILQDSYIKAFTHLNELNSPELFDSWLKRIVANCSKNFLKVKKPMLFSDIPENASVNEFDEETDPELIPHEFVDKNETSRLLIEVINKLPENKRLVILMYYYQEMSTKEISETLELPLTTVKYYLLEGRKEIKTELKKLDKEGTRLYAVIPFALFPSLIGQAAENVNAPMFSSVSAKIMKNVNSDISNPHITSSESQSHTISSTKLNGGKNMFLKTTASKIIAAVVAVAVVGGGVTAAVIAGRNNQPQPVETSQVSQKDNAVTNEVSQKDNTSSQENSQASQESNTQTSEEPESSYTPAEDFEYEFTADGVKITKYIGKDSVVVIPDSIEGKPVVEMGYESASTAQYFGPFSDCVGLKSITIPNSITKIGNGAFYGCTGLTDVNIPNSITEIGSNAFYYCTNLKDINIPDSVSEIGSYAFSDCTGLTDINIPDSVTKIGTSAFNRCTNLTNINISDSVSEIGMFAFDDTAWYDNQPDGLVYAGNVAYDYKGKMPENTNLVFKDGTTGIFGYAFGYAASLSIPDSVIYIDNPFTCLSTEMLEMIRSQPDGVLYFGKVALEYRGELPENVNSIKFEEGTKAICLNPKPYRLNGLKSMDIPASVVSIDIDSLPDDVLINVDNDNENYSSENGVLFNKDKSVLLHLPYSEVDTYTIPAEVRKISNRVLGQHRHSACSVNNNNKYYSSEDGVLFNKDKSVLLSFPCSKKDSYTIPSSVTTIAKGAFWGSQLTSVTIPDSVTSIGEYAFRGSNLTNITISSNVKTISYNAFAYCSELKNINIPYGVKKIDNEAFYECTGLTNVNLPDSITEIGASAFSKCTNLSDINIPDSVAAIRTNALDDTQWYNTFVNTQPDGAVYFGKVYYAYKGTMPANTNFEFEDGTTGLADGAFSNCTGLTGITIPYNFTEIPMGAFLGCKGLKTITLPDSVTRIWPIAFANCTSLTDIYIPDSVTRIERGAFQDCSSLTIHGKSGSAAETYAKENNIPFVAEIE